MLEGFLYGKVDKEGKFTGNDITYIYPDFQTGLQGQFEDGVVVAARPVSVIGERCQNGIKEILTSFIASDDTIWTRQISNSTHISDFPKEPPEISFNLKRPAEDRNLTSHFLNDLYLRFQS